MIAGRYGNNCSVIGNEAEPDVYEVMVQLRDYAFVGENRLVGVGCVPLADVMAKGSLAAWVQLGKRLQIDTTGLILLRILSQRQQDELAKEFVKLKTEARYEEAPPNR
jgi:protein unc-13